MSGPPRFLDALSVSLFGVCLFAAALYAVLGWWWSVLVVLIGAAFQAPNVVHQARTARETRRGRSAVRLHP